MADSTILLLPAASALSGSEKLPLVQGGVTKVETLSVILAPTEKLANKGAALGYASLDGSGLVPASQLPSYIDDVLEFANIGAFPAVGVTGIIYVSLATNLTYRWSGTIYVKLSDGAVSSFNSRVGAILPVAGDYTKGDVGLGNVDNTADLAKPISTAQAMVNATFITQQKLSVASSATIVMAVGTFNKTFMNVTALAVPSTISKTGTPSDGDILHFQIKDNGTARALTWSSDFENKGETLPTTTVAGKRINGMCTWDSATSKFGLIALITEA